MSRKQDVPAEVLSSMRHDWEVRAEDNPFYAIDSAVQHSGFTSFYVRGDEIVETQINPVLDRLGVETDGARVLEIGCGMGRLFPGLSRRFREVSGVDISPGMIEKGKKACPVAATWVLGDGTSLAPFDSESVDYVISFEVFQHIRQREIIDHYILELARVLKSGGAFQIQLRKASDTKRQALVRHLPRPARVVVGRAMRLVGILPVKGDIDTWLGAVVPPERAMVVATEAGLAGLELLPDEFHLPGMGYWLIGTKPKV